MENNYLSDDENELIEESYKQDFPEYENDSDEFNMSELDEEEQQEYILYQQMIYEKTLKTSDNTYKDYDVKEETSIEENKQNKQTKQKKNLNLSEFNTLVDKIIESKKPKKFISQRTQSKIKTIDKPTKIVKRSFNPKYPPL